MNSSTTKKIVLNGLMIALVFLVTFFTKIPGPVGPFNLGDAVIIITAILFGRKTGFAAGAIGSAIADLAMGYAIFAPITFIVKGLEGFVVAAIAYRGKEKRPGEFARIIAVFLGASIMICGYFIAELYILRLFNKEFGYVKAIADLPYNLIQGGVSAVIGYIISTSLIRVRALRRV